MKVDIKVNSTPTPPWARCRGTVLFCLLQDKSSSTYNRLLNAVRELITNAAPVVILTDFEEAAMTAFQEKFQSCRVTGCYFHLSQAQSDRIGHEKRLRPK